MLMKPIPTVTVNAANIHALADFIESAKYEFDMARGTIRANCGSAGCIGGHAAVLWEDVRVTTGDALTWDEDSLCEKLRITAYQHKVLCFPFHANVTRMSVIDRAKAVETLRQLALTGELDWGIPGANEVYEDEDEDEDGDEVIDELLLITHT